MEDTVAEGRVMAGGTVEGAVTVGVGGGGAAEAAVDTGAPVLPGAAGAPPQAASKQSAEKKTAKRKRARLICFISRKGPLDKFVPL